MSNAGEKRDIAVSGPIVRVRADEEKARDP
jgi:hypothetical protein